MSSPPLRMPGSYPESYRQPHIRPPPAKLHRRIFTRECGVCFETVPSHHVTAVDFSCICHDCAINWFKNAVQSEDAYNLKWGSFEFSLVKFGHILPPELSLDFMRKEQEYKTPLKERLYCSVKLAAYRRSNGTSRTASAALLSSSRTDRITETKVCGVFIGRVIKFEGGGEAFHDDLAEKTIKTRCNGCHSICCLVCGGSYTMTGHQCSGVPPPKDRDEGLEGLVRGKDFQLCPSPFCRYRRVQLIDGCNDILCKCK